MCSDDGWRMKKKDAKLSDVINNKLARHKVHNKSQWTLDRNQLSVFGKKERKSSNSLMLVTIAQVPHLTTSFIRYEIKYIHHAHQAMSLFHIQDT